MANRSAGRQRGQRGTGAVVVDIGPLSSPTTRRGRRQCKRLACALATLALAGLQLRMMLMCAARRGYVVCADYQVSRRLKT